jgi:AraC family transcriptional regulator of adaptative response / DNA-3-methyladenine glycosylase II
VNLDPELCYRAVRSRDVRFDGRFFTAVRTTGIYCRPICPARPPRKENAVFFAHAAAAEEAGFRPCLRCRPDAAPSTPAWSGTKAVVSRALRLIDEGALDDSDVDDLARRVGLGSRQLRRLFVRHVGAAPIAVAQTRRLHTARTLLNTTTLPITEIALGSGFTSVRRFNATFRERYGMAPSALRKGVRAAAGGAGIELRLAYRPPFDWEGLLAFLGPRAIAGVELVDGDSYARTVALGDERGIVRVRRATRGNYLAVSAPASFGKSVRSVVDRIQRMFDLAADPAPIADHLRRDSLLAPLVKANPGVRVPGCWDSFELAVRAIVGQQVSVAGATTIMGRIAKEFGEAIEASGGEPNRIFPRPGQIAQAAITGMPSSRAQTIRTIAAAVASGSRCLDPGASLDESVRRLTEVAGIGPWTAHYIAMRALGEPDAFPHGDLGLRRAAGKQEPVSAEELRQRAESWRPWRAYAAVLLWRS